MWSRKIREITTRRSEEEARCKLSILIWPEHVRAVRRTEFDRVAGFESQFPCRITFFSWRTKTMIVIHSSHANQTTLSSIGASNETTEAYTEDGGSVNLKNTGRENYFSALNFCHRVPCLGSNRRSQQFAVRSATFQV
jgi:hypothetical protein